MGVFEMGSYGAFVWSSFGLTFLVVIITAYQSRVRHQRTLREIKQTLEAMEA